MVVHWGGTSQFWHFQFASPQLLRYLTHTGVGVSPIQVSVSHPYTQRGLTHRTIRLYCFCLVSSKGGKEIRLVLMLVLVLGNKAVSLVSIFCA